MKNTENIRIDELLDEVHYLRGRNEILRRMVTGLKLNNSKLTLERNKLCDKCHAQSRELKDIKSMSMFEFGNTYCSSESLEADGKAFARSLMGKPLTREEVIIDETENRYDHYVGDDF